ncbi:MAG: cytochrome c biogenesis CcdA family protein [Acidimicrobiales bacterium]|jgi:cytochrome c-type biogenesis protein
MFSADLAFPFTLGLVAAFNPCGFAMLPVYVSFFLGKDTDSSTARNIMRALKVGLALTAGFVAVFGAFGILTSSLLSQGSILDYTPYVTFGLGFLLIPFGIAMLRGFELNLSTPRLQKGGDSGEVVSMFFFGVSYAVVSLGCTVGLFIAGVSNVFASGGFIDGVSVFVAYGLGMGAVIMTLTVALALAKTSIAANMRKVLPWVNRISGVLLTLSGAYLIVYGWWEIQILRGNIQQNSLVKFFENIQTEVNIWIDQTGATRLGSGLLLMVGAALIRGLWAAMDRATRYGALGGLGLAWVLLALVQSWNGERANLFILPVIRTAIGFPVRIGNWFSDPLRWAVLGEPLILGIIGISIYFRFFRGNEGEASDGLADQQANA